MTDIFEMHEAEWHQPPWDALSPIEQLLILHEAYAYKKMHECDGHFWYLVVDSGTASIECQDCNATLGMVYGVEEYQDMINGSFQVWYPRIEAGKNADDEPELLFYEEEPEDMSGCAYFRGKGTCSYGCYSEPSCQTDEPLDGWPSERFKDLP